MDKKIFYVCSYGGSGSKMLTNALNKYGIAKHIHSRKPPNKLEYKGHEKGAKVYSEWFNGIPIPENDAKHYYVIYIYRNPSHAIPSRFTNPEHLKHIQTNPNIKLEDVLKTGKDLYNLREFHDNYIKPNEQRIYKIYCVKYEDIFEKQDELSELLGIGKLNMTNKSKRQSHEKLSEIYSELIEEMNNAKSITIS